MTASITLTRRVRVTDVQFAGTVAESRDDVDTIAVLMAVVEHGGAISAAELGDHLLGAGRRPVAQRLLHLAQEHALVAPVDDVYWTVTPAGVTALRDRQVMTPVFGVWRAQLADDELLGPALLALARQSDQNLGGGIAKKSGPPRLQRLPDSLLSLVGVLSRPLFASTVVAQIVAVQNPPEGLVANAEDTPLLAWNPVTGSISLNGDDDVVEPVADPRVVAALMSGLHARATWDADAQVVRLPADALSDDEIAAAAVSRTVPSVKLSQYGRFDAVTFIEVRAAPVDAADADEWAVRRLLGRVDEYATADRFQAWAQWAAEPVGGNVPPRERLVERIAASPGSMSYWHLHAPVDWGL